MGVRFKRTKSVAPGVKVNLNKKSSSVRLGGKGAGVTFNTNGKVTHSAGVPGTGLYYTDSSGGGSSESDDSCCLGCFVPAIFLILILSVGIAFAFSECTKKPPEFSGMDVFTISDHPVYGDSFNEAKEFYKDYLDDNIVCFGGNYQKYEDNQTLIYITGYSTDNNLITSLDLYFKNTTEGAVDLDTALNIAREYLPIELMKNYYKYDRSYIIEHIDSSNTEPYVYSIHYSITERGLKTRELTKKDYYMMPYEFYILLYPNNKSTKIDSVAIQTDLPNGYDEYHYRLNNLKEKEWKYDFLS